ncbi:MAG: hypothetical protein WBE13_13830 [Candidatus Acidiferrum sp.]
MDRKQSWNRFLTPAREEDLESLYKEVMGTNATNSRTEDKPFYIKAAEMRSAEKGISTEQLLATYSERLRNSSYPTPDCLTTDEVQACASGNLLSADRLGHAEACEGCQNLLEAIQPSPEVVLELMEEVRLIAARVSGRTRAVAAGSGEDISQAMRLRAAGLFHR